MISYKIKIPKRISLNNVILCFLLLFAIRIDSIRYIMPGYQLYYYGCLAVLLISCSIFVLSKTKKSWISVLTVMLFSLFFIVTVYKDPRNIQSALNNFAAPLAITLFTEAYMRKDPVSFFKVLRTLFVLLMVIDLITLIVYPNGLYVSSIYSENWFLGYKSARVRAVTLPVIPIAAILSMYEHGKLKRSFYAVSFLAVLITYLSGATAGVVCCMLEFLGIVVFCATKSGKIAKLYRTVFNFRIVLIVFVGLNLFFAVFQSFANNKYFDYIIVKLLDKSVTLSGRTRIWTASVSQFQKSVFIGNGFIPSDEYMMITGVRGGTQPHNLMLALLVYTGIIGLLIYCAMLIITFKKIEKEYNSLQMICAISVFVNIVFGISSMNMFGQFHYAMMIMIYYLGSGKMSYQEEKT